MIDKPQVGSGHMVTKKKRLKTVSQAHKVPVYVPELKMTIMVVPGSDVAPIIERYREHKEWSRKTLN